MKIPVLVSFALALLALPASAQNVYTAKRAQSQPLIERDAKGFSRCGIRVLVHDEAARHNDYYDINVNVFPSHDEGVIEAVRVRMSEAKKGSPGPKGPAATGFWIAASGDAKALTPIEYITSETPGKTIAMTPREETYNIIVDIASGKNMQFAARYPKQTGGDRIIGFAAGLSEENIETLDACLQSIPE